MTDKEVDPIHSAALAREVGIRPGVLDRWVRSHYVTPALTTPERRQERSERGRPPVRWFHPAEADIVRRMALLRSIGVELACAATIARSWSEHPAWPVYLGHGVTLHLDDWHPEHPHQADYVAAYRAVHAQPERTTT